MQSSKKFPKALEKIFKNVQNAKYNDFDKVKSEVIELHLEHSLTEQFLQEVEGILPQKKSHKKKISND